MNNKIIITKKQWNDIPNDYKVITDDIKMCFLGCIQKGGGTTLVAVEVKGEKQRRLTRQDEFRL